MKKVRDTQKDFWFAFYTKPRAEFKAELEINELGFESFLPVITVVKQWSDRKKKVREPLFKSYVFGYGNEAARLKILEQKSVLTNVHFSGEPATVREETITGLKNLLATKEKLFVSNRLEIGTRVKIIDGPFAGISGVVFKNELDENMFAITIELLNRSVVVRLNGDAVIKELEL